MRETSRRDTSARLRGWHRDLLSVAITLSLLLLGRASLADHYRVPSGSMEPSVEIGDRVVVNKAAYGLRLPFSRVWLSEVSMPQRGDVVVVRSPENDIVLLKRVVAVGGDVVAVRRGRIALNGVEVPVSALPRRAGAADGKADYERLDAGVHALKLGWGGPDFGPLTVPAGQLLLMGDNRGNSHDSRSFGFVSKEALLGKAVAVYVRDGGLAWIGL